MTTQHTSDHEQPDHEPRVEAGVSANSQSETDKTPPSKKNWDRKTRRRHSVSTEDPSPAPGQTEPEKGSSEQVSSEQVALDQQPNEEQSKEEQPDESSSTNTSAIKNYSQPAEQPPAETPAVEEVPTEEISEEELPAGPSAEEPPVEESPAEEPPVKEPSAEELPAEPSTKEPPAEESTPSSEQPEEMPPAKTTAVKDYSKPIDRSISDSPLSETPSADMAAKLGGSQQQDEEPPQKENSDLQEDQVQETLVEVVEADETSDQDEVEDAIEEDIVEELEQPAEPESEPEPEQPQEPEKLAEPKEEAEPQDTEKSAEPEPEPEPEPESEPEPEQPQEPEPPVEPEKPEEPQEPEPAAEPKETRAPSVALLEDDFDDELYASLEVSTPGSKDALEEIEGSIDAVEAAAEEIEEPIRQEPKPEPAEQPVQTKKPTKRKKADTKPADQQAPQQRSSRQQQQQEEVEPQRTKRQRAQEQREQDHQRVQQKTERQQQEREQQRERQQQHREKQQQQREQQKQRQRQQRYLKSSSFKQAFRNLLKLNAGTAWREMRVPIVAFFVLFSLLALAVADALPAVDVFNAAIISAVHSLRGVLDTFVVTLTTIGDFLPMAGLCLVVCLILYLAKKWDSLAFFIVNVVLAIVCVQVLKLIFAVPRPTAETLVPLPQSFSFPSAHSFCSLIVFGMIGLLIYRALIRRGVSDRAARIPGIILVVFAILVGISRIYVGVHWPSDVLGGWLLAGTWLSYVGALYTAGARQTGRHQR